MFKIQQIISLLESIAPLQYQEDYDNSGLIAGDQKSDCTGVLISLDCTEAVVREALEKRCNLIVSHHPLIFKPIRSITPDNGGGRALIAAIQHGITIYSIHTNLDNVISGVNAQIADKLDLQNRQLLLPKGGNDFLGSGMVGDRLPAVSAKELLQRLRELFHVPVIRHSPLTGKPVSRIALCGGSGSFLISNALEAGADFFITADLKYHDFFLGEGELVLADIGHYESEQFTTDLLVDVIHEKFPNFAVLKSGTVTNPVNYYL